MTALLFMIILALQIVPDLKDVTEKHIAMDVKLQELE